MKVGSKDHIKVKRLKRALGIPLYQAVGILETLYQVCAQSADDGGIGRFCNEDIAIELEWAGDSGELIQALVSSGLVDECETNRLVVHDWFDHAPNFIKDRLRKRGGDSETLRNSVVNSEGCRNGDGNSETSRNSSGNSQLTKPSQANNNQTNPNHNSGRRRNRVGALASLLVDDLKDASKVLRWFAGKFPDRQSEDGRLFALAAASAALRGKDPPGLFVFIVSDNLRDSVRQSDWDAASQQMRSLAREAVA